MIKQSEVNELMIELGEWLDERGWQLSMTTSDYRRIEVWILKQEAPPALGIHIRDGIGADDKVGG